MIRHASDRENRDAERFYQLTLTAAIEVGAGMDYAPLTTLLGLMQACNAMMAEIDRSLTAQCMRTYAECVEFPPGSPQFAAGKQAFLEAATRLAQRTQTMAEALQAGGGGRRQ